MAKVIKPTIIADNLSDLSLVEYHCLENQNDDNSLVIGFITKQKLHKLYEEGDISEAQHKSFFRAVREFLHVLYSTC